MLKTNRGSIPVRFGKGGVSWIAAQVSSILGSRRPRVALISDERVALHYASLLQEELEERGLRTIVHGFPPGEREKKLRRVSEILDVLAGERFARDDVVVALGGGVVTDLAGFVAATYHRGIDWFACPTSLLGMVDAAIGGKTGVDHVLGKNLIGAFHQPLAVLADSSTLSTLEPRELSAGSAELVKATMLNGGELWEVVVEHGPALTVWSPDLRDRMIPQAARVKVDIVSADEFEQSTRMLLNLGHTFGHAIETVCGYAGVLHGEAIFLGLRAALRLSERAGLMAMERAIEIDAVLRRAPLPALELDPLKLIDAIARDKKRRAGELRWVLLEDVGRPVVTSEVESTDVKSVAQWLCEIAREGSPIAMPPLRRPRIVILNGPNLNLTGSRERDVYGTESLAELEDQIRRHAERVGVDVLIRQSNSEGELVSLIQYARHWADGLAINPGGYTHTSVAIRDAIAAVGIPTVEVHLSDIAAREEFRRESLIAPVCKLQIAGKGFAGYLDAIDSLL